MAQSLRPSGTLADVADSADALQPARAELTLQARGCPTGAMSVRRYDDHQYIWHNAPGPDGQVGGSWRTQEEFREGIRAPWRRWNECTELTVHFGCTRGLDTSIGATAECEQSITASRRGDGGIALSPVVTRVN